jgi:hypothetical protein
MNNPGAAMKISFRYYTIPAGTIIAYFYFIPLYGNLIIGIAGGDWLGK